MKEKKTKAIEKKSWVEFLPNATIQIYINFC